MAVIDRYEILARLGEGSFGEVFKAIERATGRTVAVKVLHRQDSDSLRRFYDEAVALHNQLGNEHVVELLNHAGLNDEEPHLALEFCEFGSLRAWVGAAKEPCEIAMALMQAARGLSGVHNAGGLHRDIKPENLLLARANEQPRGWRVKVVDFGLARFPNPVTGSMTFSACGTHGYIAPEILAGAPFHPRGDIYSLGIVGIEVLVGTIDMAGLAISAAPRELKELLQSMVHALPDKRPSAAEVADRLERFLARPSAAGAPQKAVAVSQAEQSNAIETILKGALAVGAAAFVANGLKALFGGGGVYYDPSVDRNRARDGQFRPF